MPWPKANAAEVDIRGIASLGGLHTNTVLPLASITKLLTALVVLHDHPLAPGQPGPTITITAAEAATYEADVQQSDSVLKVAAGEQLSELQALQGMLIASADNIADVLANWCSGTTTIFVEAMNAQAQSLGLTQTHLAGPAGVNPASTSTTTDLIQLAGDIMANPILRPIVAMPQVTLPIAGVVYNWDNVLGHDGIVGIKTGSTTQAGGNFVFAATRTIDKRPVTVLGVVLGAGGVTPLQAALNDSTILAAAAFAHLRVVAVLPAGQPVLRIKAPWTHALYADTTTPVTMMTVPGQHISVQTHQTPAYEAGKVRTLRIGETLATVTLTAGNQTVTVPAVSRAGLGSPSIAYRLGRL